MDELHPLQSFQITPRPDAGRVYIENDKLYWDVNEQNLLAIEIASIQVIGEYTTIHALHINEWFFVFVLSSEETFQVSAYATGMNDVLSDLCSRLQAELHPKLAQDKDFKSNVIYPPALAGKEMYELRVIESKTWLDRFRARLGFGNPVDLVLRDEVLNSIH